MENDSLDLNTQTLLQMKQEADLLSDYCYYKTGINLDYSEDFTKLDDFVDFCIQNTDSSNLEGIIERVAYYIFVVAEKNYGGQFFQNESGDHLVLVIGQPDYQIIFDPIAKTKLRFENGREDSLAFYYSGIDDVMEEIKSGEISKGEKINLI